jgi:hypothetical protein
MYHPHELIKLINDEHHKELRTQYFLVNQLRRSERSKAKSRESTLLGFVPSFSIPFVFDWLFQKSKSMNENDCEKLECQPTLECQSC